MHTRLLTSAVLLFVLAALAPAQGKTFYTNPIPVALGTGNAWAPTLDSFGTEIIFSSNRTGGRGGWDLWTARRAAVSLNFGPPTNIAVLNSSASDYEANLSSDGLELHFVSTRPAGPGPSNIMVSKRTSTTAAWGAPAFATGPMNGSGRVNDDPALTEDGLKLFYVRGGNIYYVTRTSKTAAWTGETAFAPANSSANEHSPTPHANGMMLIFGSTRSGGTGSSDFYMVAYDWVTKKWSTPVELKTLNSAGWDSNGHVLDVTGQVFYSDWSVTAGPIIKNVCYKISVVYVWQCVAACLVPYTRPYWPTSTMWCWRWIWRFNATVRFIVYDWRRIHTWFVGVSPRPGPGIGIPGTLIGGLEIDPNTMILTQFPGTPGLPLTIPLKLPSPGSFPPGTVFYWQAFGIESVTNKIISSDMYLSELR